MEQLSEKLMESIGTAIDQGSRGLLGDPAGAVVGVVRIFSTPSANAADSGVELRSASGTYQRNHTERTRL